MHPRFLKTFLVVARTGNITRAAQAVHLAQSSVSDQIQALETELGVELFVRTRQGLCLSPAGEALTAYAEELLALGDEARIAVHAAVARTTESLTVGALETIGAVKLPGWLKEFRRQRPDVTMNVKIAASGELLQGVIEGTLDAVFCFDNGRLHDERLVKRVVASEPLAFIGPLGDTAVAPPWDMAGAALNQRFIATARGCVYRHLFDRVFTEAGVEPPSTVSEVGSIAAIGQLVAAGGGQGVGAANGRRGHAGSRRGDRARIAGRNRRRVVGARLAPPPCPAPRSEGVSGCGQRVGRGPIVLTHAGRALRYLSDPQRLLVA